MRERSRGRLRAFVILAALSISSCSPARRSYDIGAEKKDSMAVVLIDRDTLGVLQAGQFEAHLVASGARHGEMTVMMRDGRVIRAMIPDKPFEYVSVGMYVPTGRDTILFSQ